MLSSSSSSSLSLSPYLASIGIAAVVGLIHVYIYQSAATKKKRSDNELVILIHGGAGIIDKDATDPQPYYNALQRIIKSSYTYVKTTNGATTAVAIAEYSVKLLEDEDLFNAGKGSVLTTDLTHELESSIMDGKTLKCGSVSLVNYVRNPVALARGVMDRSNHNYLIGTSAIALAHEMNLEFVNPTYYTTEKRMEQVLEDKKNNSVTLEYNGSKSDKKGTVGCAVYYKGDLAAATSTGGMSNKLSGRIGDTPIIGCGTYANNLTCCVSCTGHGTVLSHPHNSILDRTREEYMRHVAAHSVHSRVLLSNATIGDAVHDVLYNLLPTNSGGMIAINKDGSFTMQANCGGMFRAQVIADGHYEVGIWDDETINGQITM